MTTTNIHNPFGMYKYIHDSIRNNSRSLFSGMTLPQKKAITEVIRGLFVAGTPILRHLAQDEEKTAKKQGEKYSYHLGNVWLKEKVEKHALNRVKHDIRDNTIISYDMTDIAKEAAKKMEKLSTVYDGSLGKPTNGFYLHGVGVNNTLLKLEVHDGEKNTTNQICRNNVEKLSTAFGKRGIWVFDRGYDDKAFFKFLRHILKVQFIARIREKRLVSFSKNGVPVKISSLPSGKHRIYLMDAHNVKVDQRGIYLLVLGKHREKYKERMCFIANLKDTYSSNQINEMYLERWGIENIFKRAKTKFNLEKIRLLNYQKFVNLISLIQFAVNVSTIAFLNLQKLTTSLISGVLLCYRIFLKRKSLTFNLDSFISFIQKALKRLQDHPKKPPPNQLNLLPRRELKKLGSF